MSDVQDTRGALDRAEAAAVAGDFASADVLLRTALRLQEAELGPAHPDLVTTLSNLGIVAEKTERPGDADVFYRRAAAIASASLPPDHSLVVESRKNLEDFCRERGLLVDVPVVAAPAPPVGEIPTAVSTSSVPRPATTNVRPAPDRRRDTPNRLAPAIAGVVVLMVIAALIWRRPSPPEETLATPVREPAVQRPADPPSQPATPPAAPASPPAAIEQPQPPKVVSRRGAASAGPRITLASVQLCRTLSTSGVNWRCDPVDGAVSPRQLVLYTRVKSPRDTVVVHRWYRGQALRQSARLQVRANTNEGYRTFSRLTVDTGSDWRVEVTDADGDMVHEQRFTVR